MTDTLRDYQQAAVRDLRIALCKHRAIVYVLATGAGKTIVAAEIARLARHEGLRTFLLVHRRELVHQAQDTLAKACPGVTIGVEAAGFPSVPWADLHIGMVQTIVRRAHVPTPDLVIVDEAHHTRARSWEIVLSRWPNARVLGLTATPERLDGKGLHALFDAMVLGPSPSELIDAGWLAPCRVLSLPSHFRGLRRNRSGDYREDDLRSAVNSKVVADAVKAYMRYARNLSTIFFGASIEHSKQVCHDLRALGIATEHIDGSDTMQRRDHIMEALRGGAVKLVGNVHLIDEGFDAPGCACVMMGYPTASITRLLQMAGRAMRPGPDKTALILDLGGSCHELGLPDQPREWSLEDGATPPSQFPTPCGACHTFFLPPPPCPHCGWRPHRAQSDTSGPGIPDDIDTPLEEVGASPRSRRNARVSRKELLAELETARCGPRTPKDCSARDRWQVRIQVALGLPRLESVGTEQEEMMADVPTEGRKCLECGGKIIGKRSNARLCSEPCKKAGRNRRLRRARGKGSCRSKTS